MAYTKQTWTNGVSRLNATRLQHIEDGLETAAAAADTAQTTADAAIPKAISGVATDKVPVYNGSAWVAQKLVNAQIDAAAAIAYSKLSLAGSVVNADIGSSAAIAYSKLNLSGSIVNADIASSAAIAQSKIAGGWTSIVKASNEAVTSNTTLQNDDDFFFTAVNGSVYAIEFNLLYASPNAGNTPGMKCVFGEDTTNTRGCLSVIYLSGDTGATSQVVTDKTASFTAGTNAVKRIAFVVGMHAGAGGTFRMLWAQGTSDTDATTLYAGSEMRYRQIA